jgi:WD40 repeat protein
VLDSDNTVNVDERLALPQIVDLSNDLEHITIYSSATLPDADFTQRYLSSAEFAPEPGLLASLTYDATAIALEHIATSQPIHDIVHEGLNGQIQFEGGYWQQAPIFIYRYENDLLTYIAD